MTDNNMTHGEYSTYRTQGCRCAGCREANNAYHAAAREQRLTDPAAADRVGHGKYSTYVNYGCRCDGCREANTEASRVRRARLKGRAA